jgi:TonB family protein
MLDTYREGWVEMSLTVLADGRVTDVQVVDASDPDARFDEAALRAMTGWTYNPATLDGRPVDQRNMMLVLNFAMQDHPGVDKTIITAMKRIEKALDEGRLTEAEEGLRRLDDNRGMNLQAYSYLYMLWGRTMSRANSPMRRC